MIEVILGTVVILSLGVSAVLALRLRVVEERLQVLEANRGSPVGQAALPEVVASKPLEGLRFQLEIAQDHGHPIFANLLKEALLREDAADVVLSAQPDQAEDTWDLRIVGEVVCNGYAEIYYQADFTCYSPQETICTLIERPPHGDRPGNLAIELVAKLKSELSKLMQRNERRSAIRELREP